MSSSPSTDQRNDNILIIVNCTDQNCLNLTRIARRGDPGAVVVHLTAGSANAASIAACLAAACAEQNQPRSNAATKPPPQGGTSSPSHCYVCGKRRRQNDDDNDDDDGKINSEKSHVLDHRDCESDHETSTAESSQLTNRPNKSKAVVGEGDDRIRAEGTNMNRPQDNAAASKSPGLHDKYQDDDGIDSFPKEEEHPSWIIRPQDDGKKALERIAKDGKLTRPATEMERKRGRAIGAAYAANCFVCRRYLDDTGGTTYTRTTFRCSTCKMPLCKMSRAGNPPGRDLTCLDEHLGSNDSDIGCFGPFRPSRTMPKSKQINLHMKPPPSSGQQPGDKGNSV